MKNKDEQKAVIKNLEYIISNMSTKDELQDFKTTTKDELAAINANMATKDELQNGLSELNEKIDNIYKLLDSDIDKRTEDEMERASLTNQVNRHEDWIHVIAQKTNVELVST